MQTVLRNLDCITEFGLYHGIWRIRIAEYGLYCGIWRIKGCEKCTGIFRSLFLLHFDGRTAPPHRNIQRYAVHIDYIYRKTPDRHIFSSMFSARDQIIQFGITGFPNFCILFVI